MHVSTGDMPVAQLTIRTRLCSHRYFAGGFYINNVQVPGSVIAQEDLFLLWRPRRWEQVTVESLAFLDLITPAPQVVVFGCGASAQPLTPPVAAYLRDKGIQAEVLDSVSVLRRVWELFCECLCVGL
jgi:uncharacterized protein